MRAQTLALFSVALCLSQSVQSEDLGGCAASDACPGLTLSGAYTGELHDNRRGGMARGSATAHMLEAGATWSSSGDHGMGGLTSGVSMMYIGGRGISSSRVGDLQGLNNIEAPKGLRLYEVWSEARFGERGPALRAGMLDLNADFDVPATTSLFVAAPHGIGSEIAMSGSNGPAIWPVTGLGLRLQGDLRAGMQWRLAAYEGEPGRPDSTDFVHVQLRRSEGALLIGELSWSPRSINKLQMGFWSYTASFQPLDPSLLMNGTSRGNRGAYLLLDARLAQLGATRFDAALRLGLAEKKFNTADQYVGLALAATNFWSRFPDDAIGLAAAHAHTGAGWRAHVEAEGILPLRSETSLELTWRHAFTDWVAVLPHVQFVRNPGAVSTSRDAWIVGLRLEVSRSRRWLTAARQEEPGSIRVAQSGTED